MSGKRGLSRAESDAGAPRDCPQVFQHRDPRHPKTTCTILSVIAIATCVLGAGARVKVRVRNGDTGQWLVGAKVKSGDLVLFTDSAGECVVPAVQGRRLVLNTSMIGAYPTTETVIPSGPDAQLVVKLYGTQPRMAIGFVRNGSTSKPLPMALVTVKGDTAKTKTDSTGMYAIPFPPGDRELIAVRPGFRGFPRHLSVTAGDTLSADLLLYDTSSVVGEVAGKVEVQDFGAAIGASVTVEGTRLGTASDRNGGYFITGIPAGEHRLIFTYAACKKTMRVVNVEPWKSLVLNVQLERRMPGSGY